jgi:pectate lyase
VKARDPKTKLGAYQYTQARKTEEPTDDNVTLSWLGDRAKRQFGPDFPGHTVLEATMLLKRLALTIYSDNALMQLQVGQDLGADGKDLLEWTREGMAAFVQHAQIPGTNLLRPMLTDGTDLTDFVVKRDGYYDRKGTKLAAYKATPELMIAYARGFLITGDKTLWQMARGIGEDSDLGDIGSAPGKDVKVNLKTKNADAHALFSLLDLYRQTHADAYLQLARCVGDNVVRDKYHHGYFTPYEDTIYANVNAIEPYALLALDATIKGTPEKVPSFINGFGFFSGEYKFPNGKSKRINDDLLYRPRKSAPDLPFERLSTNNPES